MSVVDRVVPLEELLGELFVLRSRESQQAMAVTEFVATAYLEPRRTARSNKRVGRCWASTLRENPRRRLGADYDNNNNDDVDNNDDV